MMDLKQYVTIVEDWPKRAFDLKISLQLWITGKHTNMQPIKL